MLLFCRQHIDHLCEIVEILLQRRAFRGDVNVVEAVVRHVQLVEKLKGNVGFTFCHFEGVTRLLPRTVEGTDAKHIGPVPAERVPVAGRKPQVFFHAFTQHQLIRIIVTESQRVSGLSAFITNAIELIEIGLHNELHIQGCGG